MRNKTILLSILLLLLLLCGCNHTHEIDAWAVVKEPTCLEEGYREGVCKCGEKSQESIPALGHTVVIDEEVPPTCAKTGLTEGSHCSVCGEIIVQQEAIEKLEHTLRVLPERKVDCVSAGLSEGQVCTVCGKIVVAQQVTFNPLGHELGETTIITAADCENDGLGKAVCQRCGAEETVIIPAMGHSWEAATCVSKKTCSVCGKTEGNLSSHKLTSQTIDATCAKKGKTVYTCTVCGYTYEKEIQLKEHSWINATCTAPKTCSVCGKTEGSALGHTTTDGVCSRCYQTVVSPYRQAINEENANYQQMLEQLSIYETQLNTQIEIFNSTCSRMGIYYLQSPSYYNSRISSLTTQIQNLTARMYYTSSASERLSLQSQINSLQNELQNYYTCLDLANQKSDLENQINTLALARSQVESEHQSNLAAIEKKYNGG